MVAIDEQLSGISMCLRPSMKKFAAKDGKDRYLEADIEIAEAFWKPKQTCESFNDDTNEPDLKDGQDLNRYILLRRVQRCLTTILRRSMIMILENLAVKMKSFMDLQDMAVADARTINDSLLRFQHILKSHSLGGTYRLISLADRLMKIGLGIGHSAHNIDDPFFSRVRHVAMFHVLRDIKHGARIPIPNSFHLVGVPDEGPAYMGKPGFDNVYCLSFGKIFGKCTITFSTFYIKISWKCVFRSLAPLSQSG